MGDAGETSAQISISASAPFAVYRVAISNSPFPAIRVRDKMMDHAARHCTQQSSNWSLGIAAARGNHCVGAVSSPNYRDCLRRGDDWRSASDFDYPKPTNKCRRRKPG
jgi:hypothetical protein